MMLRIQRHAGLNMADTLRQLIRQTYAAWFDEDPTDDTLDEEIDAKIDKVKIKE